MAAILTWYQSRMRGVASTPPATDPNAVVINMGDLLDQQAAAANKPKKHETLFGPSLGTVSSGPAWANQTKASQGDELTPETVKAWVAKSKEPSQPTTTLQALVNLKRPSLRLTPVTSTDPTEDMPTAHHGLEFEYDADAPKCQISLHFVPDTPSHSATTTTTTVTPTPTPPTLLFETIVEGGFTKALKLDDGALLDLAKLEAQDKLTHNKSSTSLHAVAAAATPETSVAGPADVAGASTATAGALNPPRPNKKRFSAFHFRKKVRASATGPALQVVDEQAPVIQPADGTEAPKVPEVHDEEGVRLTIRLEALDENDHVLAAPNSQVTYLHVVRLGQAPASGEEDTRPWVVKVVKREATIGLHTFHLHEIYGLSSATAPAPAPASYPPTTTPAPEDAYDFAGTECVLCLSEPREVVLLPCRHLVACKECAINMIEFGAGGTLTHDEPQTLTEAPAPVPTDPLSAAEAGTGPGPNPAEDPIVTPAAPRRKRKAKGWFCPVCRQPYTSLLRITTTAPNVKKEIDDAEEELKEKEVTTPSTDATAGGGWIKPSFLRSLSAKKSSVGESRPGSGAAAEARPGTGGGGTRPGSIVAPQTPIQPRSGEVTPAVASGRVSPTPVIAEDSPVTEKAALKAEEEAPKTHAEPEAAPAAKSENAPVPSSAQQETPEGDSSSKPESQAPAS